MLRRQVLGRPHRAALLGKHCAAVREGRGRLERPVMAVRLGACACCALGEPVWANRRDEMRLDQLESGGYTPRGLLVSMPAFHPPRFLPRLLVEFSKLTLGDSRPHQMLQAELPLRMDVAAR